MKTEVMRAKRAAHEVAIEQAAMNRRANTSNAAPAGSRGASLPPVAPLASGRFRDDGFFLDATPKAGHITDKALSVRSAGGAREGGSGRALAESVMDLLADDADGAARSRRLVQWDARKRRYVSLHGGDADAAARRGNKRMRTESGSLITGKIPSTSTGLYKRWQAKTKQSVTSTGVEMENEDAPARRGRGGRRGRGRGRGVPNAHAREELKSTAQIQKHRKLEERKTARGGGRGGGERGRGRTGRGGGRGRRSS